MTPTKPSLLIVLAVLATAFGWAIVRLFSTWTGSSFPVPWTASATLALFAVALFIWGLLIRPRILRKKGTKPISPFIAARTAALAMAASRTGALVAGFYAGIAIDLSSRLDNPVWRDRMWLSLAAVGAAVLLVLAALWLEYICRLRLDDDDEKKGKEPESEPNADWVLPSSVRKTK